MGVQDGFNALRESMGSVSRHKIVVKDANMARSEEFFKVVEDVSLDVRLLSDEIVNLILEFSDSIPPPPISGKGMKEGGVGIPFCDLGDSRFDFPKIFSAFKKAIVIRKKFTLQVVEKWTSMIVRGFLDPIKPSKNNPQLIKTVVEDRVIPLVDIGLKFGDRVV